MLLRGLVDVKILSKAWSTKNNVVNPQNYAQKEESYAARNTNGTGHVPLQQQVIPWAMRSNVSVFHRADNRLDMRWARVE